MAATDPAMDKKGNREESRLGQLSPMAQDGNPLGPSSHRPPPTLDHQDQPLALDSETLLLFRDGCKSWERTAEPPATSTSYRGLVFIEAEPSCPATKLASLGISEESLCSPDHSFHVCVCGEVSCSINRHWVGTPW